MPSLWPPSGDSSQKSCCEGGGKPLGQAVCDLVQIDAAHPLIRKEIATGRSFDFLNDRECTALTSLLAGFGGEFARIIAERTLAASGIGGRQSRQVNRPRHGVLLPRADILSEKRCVVCHPWRPLL